MNKEILVSLTTAGNPNWRQTITELKECNINRFALFLTMMPDYEERMDLMKTIQKNIPDAEIPFAHIRQDMKLDEIDFLINTFGLKTMNTHPTREYPLAYDYSHYMKMLYIENAGPASRDGLKSSDIEGFAGICADISHLENAKRQGFSGHPITLETLKKFPIGANHISAIHNEIGTGAITGSIGYTFHKFDQLADFDYLKNYGPEFFGPYIALEVYNSIPEQLGAKKYIENILSS